MFKQLFSKKHAVIIIAMSIAQPLMAGSSDFIFSVDTQLGDGVNTFTILTNGVGYNYNVDCDDDNPNNNTALAQTGNYTCNFASPGIYTIRIKDNVGDNTGFPSIAFNNGGDKDKITDLIQWGTGKWASMEGAFWGASNMIVTATDVPDFSQVTSLANMFAEAAVANPDTSKWNTGNVKNMSNMFFRASAAIPDTSDWDTTEVTDMTSMFEFSDIANPDTSGWNTAKVMNMSYMFADAVIANPDTSGWNTANVTDMNGMFIDAVAANPDTSGWDITAVNSMQDMFDRVTLPIASYEAMLIHFNSQSVQSGVEFNGGDSKYCTSIARDNLINTYGWRISDGGLDSSCGDVIFRNSFEFQRDLFIADDQVFTFDFGLLDPVKLDSYPELIAIGLDDEKETVIKIHVRRLGKQLQIRISDLDINEFGEHNWINQEWENITNSELTTVSW